MFEKLIRLIPVIVTNRFIPKHADALCLGLAILIRPQHRNNTPLLAHERQHCRQFFRSFGVNALLYLISRRHRYRLELEAYGVQLRLQPRMDHLTRAGDYAEFLVANYGLKVRRDTALSDLIGGLTR